MTAFVTWARRARSYSKSASLGTAVLASALALACGGGQTGTENARSPERQTGTPSPFDGLVPCSKDDTTGKGCAKPGAPRRAAESDATVWKVPVTPDDPVLGPADALVTAVAFSDFECPFCKRTAADLARLREAHPKDLRLVWKDCPSSAHSSAVPAAQFARGIRAAKGDAGFWAAHDRLYASQGELGDPLYQKIAGELGVPWPPIRAAIANALYGGPIHAGLSLADAVAVDATPTVFVNGKKIVGAQSYDTFEAVAQRELAGAEKLVSGGTPRARVYASIIAGGKQVAPPTDLR